MAITRTSAPLKNPLGIHWPKELRPGKAPPYYLTTKGKLEFQEQLFQDRVKYLDRVHLSNADRDAEVARQFINLKSKQLKMNSNQPKLSKSEELKRKLMRERAKTQVPEPPPGTRPTSPEPEAYIPIRNPETTNLTAREKETLNAKLAAWKAKDRELADEGGSTPVEGVIPGIQNSDIYHPTWSDLRKNPNTNENSSIWSAISIGLTNTYSDWVLIKANIIEYYFRVLGDFNHPRHRVYHVLQKRSEQYNGELDLMSYLVSHDSKWSMDPGLWTVIADFYGIEVVIIRDRGVCPPGTVFPSIFKDDFYRDRECTHFVISRGMPNGRGQLVLYFARDPDDGTERVWSVDTQGKPYRFHRRPRSNMIEDLSNRVDDMPWAYRGHKDPTKGLRFLKKLDPTPQDEDEYKSRDVAGMVTLEKDLTYLVRETKAKWDGKRRDLEHINTWTKEIREPTP